jgi:hypothetical protein
MIEILNEMLKDNVITKDISIMKHLMITLQRRTTTQPSTAKSTLKTKSSTSIDFL